MNSVDLLKRIKTGEYSLVEQIIDRYKNFIFFEMKKYHIKDEQSCYEEVRANILKAICYFDIEEK